jgi:pimeloyl-ACP methyl ester carboxylesterase
LYVQRFASVRLSAPFAAYTKSRYATPRERRRRRIVTFNGSSMLTAVLRRALLPAVLLMPSLGEAQVIDTLRVRVHNHEMALFVAGSGGDVVVLEAGGGSSHRVWSAVVPDLIDMARVVAYDRPGYGLSAPCDSPRTADRIARELREALRSAGIAGPYLVAGWSFGGSIARVFSGNFPNDVTGLVLVDPAPATFYPRAAGAFPDLWAAEEEAYVPALFADSTKRAEQREFAGFSASMEQAKASDARHSTPTVLLIAARDAEGPPDPISALWIEELSLWGSRRPNTHVRMVSEAGHHIARDQPAAVVDAVRELLGASRER